MITWIKENPVDAIFIAIILSGTVTAVFCLGYELGFEYGILKMPTVNQSGSLANEVLLPICQSPYTQILVSRPKLIKIAKC
jgi:hypothetical protein